MGNGSNPLAPMNKMAGELYHTARYINKVYDKKDNKR